MTQQSTWEPTPLSQKELKKVLHKECLTKRGKHSYYTIPGPLESCWYCGTQKYVKKAK